MVDRVWEFGDLGIWERCHSYQVEMNCTARRFVDLAVASVTKQLGLTGGEWCAKPIVQ